jgi:thiol-disulfide isomerase/thioredoxin
MRIGIDAIVCTFLLVAATALATTAAAQRSGAQRTATSPTSNVAGLLGKPAPNFAVRTLDGRPVTLSDYKGKAIIVNFWATWCGNCKLEMPWLAELREKYASEGFEVLGIVTDNVPLTKISALTQKYGVQYPILMCNHKTAQAYGGLPELPASFFVDRHGIIVAEMDGADSKQQIEANIRKALERPRR